MTEVGNGNQSFHVLSSETEGAASRGAVIKKKFMKSRIILFLMSFLPCAQLMAQARVTVTNPSSLQRQELVAIDAQQVYDLVGISQGEPFVVSQVVGQKPDGSDKLREVDFQVTSDGKLLIDASVQPGRTTEYVVERGVPRRMRSYDTLPQRTAAGGWGVGKVWTEGRLYPERLDDIAWENDRGAYRVYGPAFQRNASIGYGPDVWVKNTPELVVARRFSMEIDIKPTQRQLSRAGYKAEADQLVDDNSFHIDHGMGNDCYAVGATLGCGAPAILSADGNICFPYAWQQYEILDNGPLRFTMSLVFGDTLIEGRRLQEHRIISLDKGSNFNRVEVWYEDLSSSNRPDKPLTICAGFPLHAPNESTVVLGKDFIQYADPTDNPTANAFQLYVGCLFPDGEVSTRTDFGHAIGVTSLKVGEHWTYYAGSAWSKYDVRNQVEWQARINTTLDALKNPLNVEINHKGKP